MGDRTVSVRLTLKNDGFVAGLRQANRQTKEFTDGLSKNVKKNRGDIDEMARGFGAVGLAAGVGIAVAVKKFADFDQAMSNVKAATHESAANMEELRAAAVKAGKETAFSATEAAEGIENLAKAGVSTKDILGGGLSGALDLAAAGELGVADAAEIAATAMTQFKLSGKEVPHIADLLAAGAGKAQGEVSDMAMALKQGGLVASQMGLSIEETTGTLAAFASAGLIGSDAGTSFKTMLLALANPSEKAANTMEQLGINTYDAQGAFMGVAPLAEQLKTKLGGLSEEQRNAALATIFGSDAIRAASVLYQNGAAGISDWTTKVNDQGFAAETAAIKTDNLKGDIERLGGSIDTALIQQGSGANDALRGLAQAAGLLVDGIGNLPDTVSQVGLALGGIVTVGGLGAGGLLKAADAASRARESWQALGTVGKRLTLSMGAVGVAITAGLILYGAFSKKNEEASQKADDLRDTLDEQTGAITQNTRSYVANELAQNGLAEKAKDLGLSLSTVTDAALGNDTALQNLVGQLDEMIRAGTEVQTLENGAVLVHNEHAVAAGKLKDELLGTNAALTDAQKKHKLAAEGAGEHKTAQQLQAEAVAKATEKIQQETESLSDLIEKMHAASGEALSLSGAQISYQAALDAATASVKENGRTLNIGTEAGRANKTALDALAASANDQTDAMLESGKSNLSIVATGEQARKKFIEVAIQMGLNKTEAKRLAQQYIDIPAGKTTTIKNNAGKKQAPAKDVAAYHTQLHNLPVEKDTKVKASGIPAAWQAISTFSQNVDESLAGIDDKAVRISLAYTSGLGKNPKNQNNFATGGPVFGAGTSTSDSIPAWLSNDEHVWTAKEVQAAGGHGAVKKMRQAALQGYATGGGVSLKATTPSLRQIDAVNLTLAKVMGKEIYEAKGGAAAGWARSQVGKPYVWGGVGPNGYDCSGFMSAITNVIMGRYPHSRLFATGGFPTAMFSPGYGRFAIGSVKGNPGHMAGTLGGMNVESRGGAGVVVGSSARGARDALFGGNVWHLKGYAKGGPVGDAPFDLLDPRGKAFKKVNGYRNGGLLMPGELGYNETSEPEVVLNKPQLAELAPPIDYSRLAQLIAAPDVRVFIGNEEITDRMQIVVDNNNRKLKRDVRQGVVR